MSRGDRELILANKRGEAMLAAIADTDAGLDGDLARSLRLGLRSLRALGQRKSPDRRRSN